MKFIDLTGKKFGRWTVIKRSIPNNKRGLANWLCKCECGTIKIVCGGPLRRGHSKSCGCLQKEIATKMMFENSHHLKYAPGIANMISVIRSYKKSAKVRGLIFDLTKEQFIKLIQKECYYCGAKPNNIKNDKNSNGEYVYNGIDRIDSNKGYTMDNVVSCCPICNYAKRDLPLQKFKDWIERAYNNINRKGVKI